MLKVVTIMLGLLLSAGAMAASVQINWTLPTQTEDAVPVPATGQDAVVSTTVEYSVCGSADAFGAKLGEIVVASPKTSGVVTVQTAGRYCFRAYVSTGSERSDYSNIVAKVLTGSRPKAPVLVNVVVVVL